MGISPTTRFAVFRRDRFLCQYCGQGAPDVSLEVDHVTPRCAGGSDDLANLLTACYACNRGKAGRELTTWEQLIMAEPTPCPMPPRRVPCVGGPLDGAAFTAHLTTAFRWVFRTADSRYLTPDDALGITREGHWYVTVGTYRFLRDMEDQGVAPAELTLVGVYLLFWTGDEPTKFAWLTPEDFLVGRLGLI